MFQIKIFFNIFYLIFLFKNIFLRCLYFYMLVYVCVLICDVYVCVQRLITVYMSTSSAFTLVLKSGFLTLLLVSAHLYLPSPGITRKNVTPRLALYTLIL